MAVEPSGTRELLRQHLLAHSLRRADPDSAGSHHFRLKSGKNSDWFIDAKNTLCAPAAMLWAVEAMAPHVPPDAEAVGGMTMGADPIAYMLAFELSMRGHPLSSFSVRNEDKDHGAGGRIAGILLPGQVAVVVDDVVTRGASMLEAIKVVRKAGGHVSKAIALVDRGGQASAVLAAHAVELRTIFSAPDLGLSYAGA